MAADSRIDRFDPVDLDGLQRMAGAERAVENKYLVDQDELGAVLRALEADHLVLEIDGHRRFGYRSVYFDSPDLACYRDLVDDRIPRFRARTRHYTTTGACVFEVKVRHSEAKTTKHRTDYDGGKEDRVTDDAVDLIHEPLAAAGIEPPATVQPTLVTQFRRSTITSPDGQERITVDTGVQLTCGGRALVLRGDRALVESKTETGDGLCDRTLRDRDLHPLAFDKYRLGISTLADMQADETYAPRVVSAFEERPAAEDDRAAEIFHHLRSTELGVAMGPSPNRVLGDR